MNRNATTLLLCLMLSMAIVPAYALAADYDKGSYGSRSNASPEAKDRSTYGSSAMSVGDDNILSVASENDSYSIFIDAVSIAGLNDTLENRGPYTVFIPSNAAFENLPEGVWDDLLLPENRAKLRSVLQYHIVPGRMMAADLNNIDESDTLFGRPVTYAWYGGQRQIGEGAVITAADIEAGNGTIQVIDTVLMPPTSRDVLVADSEFEIFEQAVETAGIDELLDSEEPYTVFVPSEQAFAEFSDSELSVLLEPSSRSELRSIVNMHVVPGVYTLDDLRDTEFATSYGGRDLVVDMDGNAVVVENARIISSIPTLNGMIHVVDNVMLPETAVAGSYMQRYDMDDDDYYMMLDKDDGDYEGGRCYATGDYDRSERKGRNYHSDKWNHKSHWDHDGCGCGCGHRSGCWHNSWHSHSTTPEWWENWGLD